MPARLSLEKLDHLLKWNSAAKKFDVMPQKQMSQGVLAVTLNIKKKGANRSQFSYAE